MSKYKHDLSDLINNKIRTNLTSDLINYAIRANFISDLMNIDSSLPTENEEKFYYTVTEKLMQKLTRISESVL